MYWHYFELSMVQMFLITGEKSTPLRSHSSCAHVESTNQKHHCKKHLKSTVESPYSNSRMVNCVSVRVLHILLKWIFMPVLIMHAHVRSGVIPLRGGGCEIKRRGKIYTKTKNFTCSFINTANEERAI